MNSFFYSSVEKNAENENLITELEKYAEQNSRQVYVINKPLGDNKYNYSYQQAIVVLIPKQKITFIDLGNNKDEFDIYVEDFIEDLTSISDKYRYKEVLGRQRAWRDKIVFSVHDNSILTIDEIITKTILDSPELQKKCELIISLLICSINDIDKVKENIPNSILDKIKQKIILFDGDQTRFIYENPEKKQIRIQGLSGTGKTELLLHKMKDIYLEKSSPRILFTCHNKILAYKLKERIPEFFNFMRVEQQIKWNERLMCVHAWGSSDNPYSGAYRTICHFYGIPFQRFSYSTPFNYVCDIAVKLIQEKKDSQLDEFNYAFDYIFIDESQDFTDSFFDLCSLVSKSSVYVAGDIFQSIFESHSNMAVSPDHLLSKCYRTDPRTLMFAHALGMGIFEDIPLNWLSDDEWKLCGYKLQIDDSNYFFTREPLRRFEDLQDDSYQSIKVYAKKANSVLDINKLIIDQISAIREANPTVLAGDIAIIFLDNSKDIYGLADQLTFFIKREFNWDANKAYESKQTRNDAVLISNRFNVKGLEFPFVICVTSKITDELSYRNTLYTMLTRSFLQSILIITEEISEKLHNQLSQLLKTIFNQNCMIAKKPSQKVLEAIRNRINTSINQKENQQSVYDLFSSICADKGIDLSIKAKLIKSYNASYESYNDADFIEKWIETNYSLYCSR